MEKLEFWKLTCDATTKKIPPLFKNYFDIKEIPYDSEKSESYTKII